MRAQPHPKIQIAARSTAAASFPFTADPHARAFGDTWGNPHFDGSLLAVSLPNREALHRALERILEVQLDLVLHVPPGTIARRTGPAPGLACLTAAEEGAKEIGERAVFTAEHVREAAAADVDVDIEGANRLSELERLHDDHASGRAWEIVFERTVVDTDHAGFCGARAKVNASDRVLTFAHSVALLFHLSITPD